MKKVKKIILICKQCELEYLVYPYRAITAKFCSRKCKDLYLIGKAPIGIDNTGKIPWIKGKKHTAETIIKLKNRFYPKGEAHPSWIGDDIGYAGVHDWIEKELGKPQYCQRCGSSNAQRYEWANRSRTYKRDTNDWIRLCVFCHRKADYHQSPL